MARTDPQVNFRIPAELKSALEKAADANKRSLSAEVVARLENSFEIGRIENLQRDVELYEAKVRAERAEVDEFRMHLKEFLEMMKDPRFRAAMELLKRDED